MESPAKRRALDDAAAADRQSRTPTSLTRSISPPGRSRSSKRARISEPTDDEEETSSEVSERALDGDETSSEAEDEDEDDDGRPVPYLPNPGTNSNKRQPGIIPKEEDEQKIFFPSPFQLTKIIPLHTNEDYPAEYNMDTVTLSDLVGDPLISSIWEFNYLHDIDFLMDHLDPDVRHLTRVHVVHGFWKREDPNRLALAEQAGRYENVSLHGAFMPEMFGTHHSKMMVLFRRDDTAEVVIHTANLIQRDWGGMTQGCWRSGRLTLLRGQQSRVGEEDSGKFEVGSGQRFRVDFLNYLRSYDKRRPTCRGLIEELGRYDFSGVRGALVGSVPGRHRISRDDGDETLWGWAAMEEALKAVPVRSGKDKDKKEKGKAEVVIQVSSIATLGPTDTWLRGTLFEAFSGGKLVEVASTTCCDSGKAASASKMMGLGAKSKQQAAAGVVGTRPEFRIMFPTADEIRNSLDGYNSGGSIHTKISSAQQKKQLAYLKPIFYHWGNEAPPSFSPPPGSSVTEAATSRSSGGVMDAGRNRAAPHIKTYTRYRNGTDISCEDSSNVDIEWALLTSANLSKQAWGEAPSSTGSGEMRIASYELGVLVWPGLFAEGAVMRGTFLTDTPCPSVTSSSSGEKREDVDGDGNGDTAVVGLRMPYGLPLRKYGTDEIPWVATASYDEPDWRGCYWRD